MVKSRKFKRQHIFTRMRSVSELVVVHPSAPKSVHNSVKNCPRPPLILCNKSFQPCLAQISQGFRSHALCRIDGRPDMCHQLDRESAEQRAQRQLCPLENPIEKPGAERHHAKGFADILRKDGHHGDAGLQGGAGEAQTFPPEHRVGMVAELSFVDAARRYTEQSALAQQLSTGVHTARRAAEDIQDDSHAGHAKEKLVHHRVDDDAFEQKHPIDQVVVVDRNGAVVVDEEAAPGSILGKVFQAADFVAVPQPGVRVPKGGDDLAAGLPEVAVLKLRKRSLKNLQTVFRVGIWFFTLM